MDISNVLQIYEFSMAIGNSLDYQTNCENFLKLVLARKNLSACWILKKEVNGYLPQYSYPSYISNSLPSVEEEEVSSFFSHQVLATEQIPEVISKVSPVAIDQGSFLFFNLKNHGGLFFYKTQLPAFSDKEIAQLQPIINKFILSLDACESFSEQEKLLKKLAIQNQELNDYAHIVSHDLKSPLRSINALINWIQEDNSETLDQTIKGYLDKVGDNIEKMDNLINGILEYAVIDKKLKHVNTQVNLYSLLQEIFTQITVPDHIKITIKKHIPVLHADRFRMKQLFQNLITNAIQNMDKEKGIIDIRYKEFPLYWEFEIEDNGKGIPKKYHDKIFKMFQSLSTRKSSTGIGLSIVKKIIDYYDGKIWITSTPGVGTIFHFTIKKNNHD
ncbi:ATP-binding protein [Aquimarina hainanensis]|uniref:histidine kinase n=1 Tax=Aquimarina hainanensis TaxID=1578017 RepID=A0ABW5N7J4_9FLAO